MINIYSTNKNGFERLSNLLSEPYDEIILDVLVNLKTIEHGYQVKKAIFGNDFEIASEIYLSKSGFEAQKLSRKINNLDKDSWNKISIKELEKSMRLCFNQNLFSQKLLLKTGDEILTHEHSYIKLGIWEVEFPRILMSIREELKQTF